MAAAAEAIGRFVAAWARRAPADPEYRRFPDVARRNAWQEAFEVPALVRSLGLPRGGRVLEVGCGRGIALPALARWLCPRRLTGLDIDARLLAQASDRVSGLRPAVDLLQGDVRDLPLPDASFDLVVDFGTCYHVARRACALREISRVLVAGGRFVHESRLNQLLAHPVRSRGRCLPWSAVPGLALERHALLWTSRVKLATSERH
jgi:ubiquinone/menaquinone biosynthesis C-methylase UbiE